MYYLERVSDYSMMGIMIRDGSGTGARGSLSFHHHQKGLHLGTETWMGTWVSSRARVQSSNWRELRSLVEFLQREVRKEVSLFQNCRVFYFTNNTVTYDVCRVGKSSSPDLHALVTELKSLEI